MKILCLSDTHGLHKKIHKDWMVEADVLVHAGDCTNRGYLQEVKEFLDWFESLDYTYKIFICGNHDWIFEQYPDKIQELMKEYPSITYLQDSSVIIEDKKFYGSPWQPYFHNWAFNAARDNEDAITYNKPLLKDKWELIPKDTDVLITHGPSFGYVDKVIGRDENLGCLALINKIKEVKCKFHICGHIHSGRGIGNNENTTFINASILNEEYKICYTPILIEI